MFSLYVVFVSKDLFIVEKNQFVLACVAQWVGCHPVN